MFLKKTQVFLSTFFFAVLYFFFPQKCRVFFGTPIISECLFVETFLIQEAAKRTESSKFPFPASSSFLVEKKNRRFVVVLFDDDDARFRIGAIWTTKNGLEYSPVRNPNKSHKVVASESVPSSFSTKANASTPRTPPTRRRLSLSLSLSLSAEEEEEEEEDHHHHRFCWRRDTQMV